jgi:hypothetical protein
MTTHYTEDIAALFRIYSILVTAMEDHAIIAQKGHRMHTPATVCTIMF